MGLDNEIAAMCRASTFKDAGPTTAVGLQRSITQTDHQCLLPSPALPGAGSTVGTSEVPSQPGPSELPWADSRTPDLPCAQVQLTQTVWQLALPNDRFNHHVLGFGLVAGRGDLATGSGPSINKGCPVGLMSAADTAAVFGSYPRRAMPLRVWNAVEHASHQVRDRSQSPDICGPIYAITTTCPVRVLTLLHL